MALATDPKAALFAAIDDMTPALDAAWREADSDRRVPTRVVDEMRRAGLFRMVAPAEFGGGPVDVVTFTHVIEAVARANGAAAWDLAASTIGTLYALGLPPSGLSRVYANGPDVVFAGTAAVDRDTARAVAADGGYSVTGRWTFGSGCQDADWLLASTQVFDGVAPRPDEAGLAGHEYRYVVFPRAEVEVLDTWRVIGMRGTGSHDWAARDAFVPDDLSERSAGLVRGPVRPRPWRAALYRFPIESITALHFASVATGIARRAIDCLTDLAGAKKPHRASGLLRERVQVQEAVARAEVILESARAYRDNVVADAWATVEAGETPSLEQRARIRIAGSNAAECAARAVDMMYSAGGATSIEEDFPLSRCFRDVHVVTQHGMVAPLYYEYAGKVLLGLGFEGGRPF